MTIILTDVVTTPIDYAGDFYVDIDCDDGDIEEIEEANSDQEEGSSEPSNNSNMMQQED